MLFDIPSKLTSLFRATTTRPNLPPVLKEEEVSEAIDLVQFNRSQPNSTYGIQPKLQNQNPEHSTAQAFPPHIEPSSEPNRTTPSSTTDLGNLELTEIGQRLKSGELSFAQAQKLVKKSPLSALRLLGKLPPKANLELKSLSKTEQSQALRLLNLFSGQSLKVKGRVFFPTQSLSRLLENGTLTQKDREGNTLLSNIDQMLQLENSESEQPIAAWFTVHAAHPKRSYHQLPHSGTCVATSLSYMGLEDNPAEMSRITLNLFRDGQHELPNGETMKQAVGSAGLPSDGASPVEQVLQASLTDYSDPNYQYDFKSNLHFTATSTRRGRLWVDQQLRMANLLAGVENKAVKVDSGELQKLFKSKKVKRIAADIYWEAKPETSLFNKAKHGRHMVVLTGVDDKFVYFRNPHGGQKSLEGSSHKIHGYGFGRMDRAEFDERLHHTILDSSLKLEGEEPVKRTFLSHLEEMFE